jgi:predicted CXXCH cytochrome family protein
VGIEAMQGDASQTKQISAGARLTAKREVRSHCISIGTTFPGLALFFILSWALPETTSAQQASPSPPLQPTLFASKKYAGNEACAKCHAEIYKSYAATAMAQASGPAMQGLLMGEFLHATSRVHYRVYSENGQAWMSFERSGDNEIRGKKELLYFIGTGHRGRTYLFSQDNFVFEAPINWYGQQQLWDMAPAYQKDREIPMNLPAVSACLACHTSDSQSPLPGTENQYAQPLFTHAGVACERCHGPGNAHVESGGTIVNPSKLAPDLRDAICIQCHFEGRVAIQQPGHALADFQAGDRLSDFVHYFVLTGNPDDKIGALSQTEALSQSVCKRKSGDSLSCTSCHDPHFTPKKTEAGSYYRKKCLACHGEKFGAKHKSNQADCRPCHMPEASTSDIAHTQATDHRILRRPVATQPIVEAPANPRLLPFPEHSGKQNARDMGLAWETLSEQGMRNAAVEADQWLHKAVQEVPDDAGVLSALGYEEQKHGHIQQAREHYLHALEIDPLSNEAALNLGVIEAQAGNADAAINLWQGPFDRIPGRSEVGMNLALLYCSIGKMEKARTTLTRVLKFNPDLTSARNLQRQLNADPATCGVR